MPIMKNVLGLDLGSHTFKAVELRQTMRGLEPGQLRIQPRADAEAPVAESLSRFLRMHQISTDHPCTALAGDRISTRRLEFPFRDRKKLSAAVPFEVEGEIPFDIEDVLIDWELQGGGDRSHGVVTATVARRNVVADLLHDLSEGGVHPRILEAEGLVLANLTALFPLDGTRMLVDMGHRKTTFCLIRDGHALAARTIPVGGLALTRAISRDRGLELEQAEQSKCEEGIFDMGFNGRSAGAVDVLDRIARELLVYLESLEGALGGPISEHVEEVTLLGGGAHLHRVDEFLRERLGLAVARLRLPEDPEAAALIAGGDHVTFAPAIALALRASSRARTRLNFRKEEFAYKADLAGLFTKEMRPTAIMLGIVVFLMLCNFGASVYMQNQRANRLEAQAAAIFSTAFPGESAGGRPLSNMTRAVSEARERADLLGVYKGNLSAMDLLSELSRRVPSDLEVNFEEVSIDARVIRLRVDANDYESTDRLVNALKGDAPFTDAAVSGSIKTNKDGSVSFNLSIPLEDEGEPT